MSWAPTVLASFAMPTTRSGSTSPSNGQVNAVAMHSWMEPPTSWVIRTASGIAATLASVLRPMLAWLWESEADRQYWKFRAPAAAAFSMCRGVATQTQQRSSSSGVSAEITSSVSASGGTRSAVPSSRSRVSARPGPAAADDLDLAIGGQHLRGELKPVAQGDVAQVRRAGGV